MAPLRRALWLARNRLRHRGILSPEVLPTGVRLTTYNIGRGARGDRGARSTTLDRVAATIAAERPDVVALQEIHEPDLPVIVDALRRHHDLDYHAAFGAALTAEAMAALVERARTRPGFDEAFYADRTSAFGVAVLSRTPLDDVRVEVLPGAGERRIAVVARTTLAGLASTVIATHLATVSAAAVRDEQTRAVLALAAAARGPVVVAGDLNQEPADVAATLATSHAALAAATDPDVPTLGRRTIDHVLVGPGVVARGAKVGEAGVSDHRPVTVALTLG
ncbi:MAG TPA: endonuclease/exonuclease/phosphatase family protein [Iamia sp.]|nr:endonuclease/exonuclease/phosphatase family protein [Iamia sp.]